MKKIAFLTGTRADYGKLKSLMKKVDKSPLFELQIFATGMHMLSKYGSTYTEIEKDGFKNIYKYINQKPNTSEQMDIILSNTIVGFSCYIAEMKPDLIVVHGDRVEALAATMVGALNNIKVMHIEGGEVSGTIDESIRHAITKFAHFHLVANEEAKKRIIQLGELEQNIFIFGSADIDIMYSKSLPSLEQVKQKYEITFDKYNILMYHPVTTEVERLEKNVEILVDNIIDSKQNYIIIYPNNDNGSDIILKHYKRLEGCEHIKIYPSMRFEYFLTLLKNSEMIIGNSSCGIREACVYGIPTIDIGNRQKGRYSLEKSTHILHIEEPVTQFIEMLEKAPQVKTFPKSHFGEGKSDELFIDILMNPNIWKTTLQKKFNDIDF